MNGLTPPDCMGDLEIDGVPMLGPAWTLTDLTPLWGQVDVRGSDLILPMASGRRANQRRIDATEHSLQLIICGETDQDGDLWPNPWIGLEENLAFLRTNVVDPTGVGNGTLPAVLTMPSGDTRTADIHVLDLRQGAVDAGTSGLSGNSTTAFYATLEISIPAGRFT
jgi:hypothetical protein